MKRLNATLNGTTPYKCSRCDKQFPSPESGAAHLEKKHNGGGYLSWFQPVIERKLRYSRKQLYTRTRKERS